MTDSGAADDEPSAEGSDASPAKAAKTEAEKYGNIVFGAPLRWPSHLFRSTARSLAKVFLRPYFRMKLIHPERLPAEGPIIIAPSHRSNLDTPLVGVMVPRWMRFMAKDSMFKSKFWSQFLVALGGFPVKRGKLDRRALQNSIAVLDRGEALVVFPEGARQHGPRIKPIFEGAVWISARTGVPILPLGIGGSQNAQPIGIKIPRSTAVHFVIGEPMQPPVPLQGKRRVSREQLDEFSADLRERLQAVFDEAQASAGTPNGEWSDDDEDDRRQPWDE